VNRSVETLDRGNPSTGRWAEIAVPFASDVPLTVYVAAAADAGAASAQATTASKSIRAGPFTVPTSWHKPRRTVSSRFPAALNAARDGSLRSGMAEIGSTLREARMRARIDMSEVEARTKIRAKYLRAIENEEWDLLPGPVYIKSFLRTYGDFLGLDSRLLIDEFKRRYERPDHDMRPVATLSRERERAAKGPLLPSWAIIGGVLVAVVVALYFIGTAGNNNKPTPTTTGIAGTTTQKTHRARHHARHTASKPKTVKLQLVPTGTVYVCLVDGTGKRLIPGKIYTSGQTIPTEIAPQMLLTLGNASVQMKVNGKSVPVAASSSSIGFMLKPTGPTPLAASKQPRCA
jgi:cytoskeletal protein RodZ